MQHFFSVRLFELSLKCITLVDIDWHDFYTDLHSDS